MQIRTPPCSPSLTTSGGCGCLVPLELSPLPDARSQWRSAARRVEAYLVLCIDDEVRRDALRREVLAAVAQSPAWATGRRIGEMVHLELHCRLSSGMGPESTVAMVVRASAQARGGRVLSRPDAGDAQRPGRQWTHPGISRMHMAPESRPSRKPVQSIWLFLRRMTGFGLSA